MSDRSSAVVRAGSASSVTRAGVRKAGALAKPADGKGRERSMKPQSWSVRSSEATTLLEGPLLVAGNEMVSITSPKVDEQMVAKAAGWLRSILESIKLSSSDAEKEVDELKRRQQQLAAKEAVTYQWVSEALRKANTAEELHRQVLGAHLSVTARLESLLQLHMTLAHLNELANQAFREEATQALRAQRQTILEQDARMYKLVQELRTTSSRARNLARPG